MTPKRKRPLDKGKKRDVSEDVRTKRRVKPGKKAAPLWKTLPGLRFFPAIFIFIFSFLLYSNTLQNGFVWDDRVLIVENPKVRSLGKPELRTIFFENFWEKKERIGGYYRPLVSLSYNLNYKLYGMKPAGFHLTNVFANALTCLLFFVLVLLLFQSTTLAVLSALIFSAIPLHTENVAWISGRTDIFASMWILVSLIFYILFRRKSSAALLSLSLAAFVLALFSKEIAVSLPFLILIIDALLFGTPLGKAIPGRFRLTGPPIDKERTAKGKRKEPAALAYSFLPYFLVLFLYFLLRREVLGSFAIYKPYATGLAPTIALSFSILAGYFFKLIYPFRLNAEYDAPVHESAVNLHAAAGFLIFIILLCASFRYREKKALSLSAAIFLLGLAPVLNLVPIGEISAERFLYFPSLGFALALGSILKEPLLKSSAFLRKLESPPPSGVGTAAAIGDFSPATGGDQSSSGAKGPRRSTGARGDIFLLAFAFFIAAYSVRTFTRNFDWRSEDILFRKTVETAGSSPRAYLNMGNVYIRKGEFRRAIPELEKALSLDPDYVDALSNLAGIYRRLGQIDKAVKLLERALPLDPTNAELHNNLGIIYVQKNRYNEAEDEFQKAIRYNPNHLKARFNLALVYLKKEDYNAALRYFEGVKEMGEEFEMAYYYVGLIMANQGAPEVAKRNLEKFLSLHKNEDEYHLRAVETLKRLDEIKAAPEE